MSQLFYFFGLVIGIGLVAIATFKPIFADWDKPIWTPFIIICMVLGWAVLISTCVLQVLDVEKKDKINTIYFNGLKSSIRNMDCKDLGNYIISNSDNYTLISNSIIDLAHNVYGVKCK